MGEWLWLIIFRSRLLDTSSDTARHITGKLPRGTGSERITSVRRYTMSNQQESFRIAILDDYQNVALSLADWSVLDARATVTVFNDHLADPDAVVERLQPFDIVGVMRKRTPMTRTIIERLPKLRLIASTAFRNASIDLKAAEERGVQVVHTGYTSAPTIELTWALILGSARNLVAENGSLRSGGWERCRRDRTARAPLRRPASRHVAGGPARPVAPRRTAPPTVRPRLARLLPAFLPRRGRAQPRWARGAGNRLGVGTPPPWSGESPGRKIFSGMAGEAGELVPPANP